MVPIAACSYYMDGDLEILAVKWTNSLKTTAWKLGAWAAARKYLYSIILTSISYGCYAVERD